MIIFDSTHNKAINVSDLASAHVIISKHYTAVEVITHHHKYHFPLPEKDCWDLFWKIINNFDAKELIEIETISE